MKPQSAVPRHLTHTRTQNTSIGHLLSQSYKTRHGCSPIRELAPFACVSAYKLLSIRFHRVSTRQHLNKHMLASAHLPLRPCLPRGGCEMPRDAVRHRDMQRLERRPAARMRSPPQTPRARPDSACSRSELQLRLGWGRRRQGGGRGWGGRRGGAPNLRSHPRPRTRPCGEERGEGGADDGGVQLRGERRRV